jgi:hypothetical protein
VAVLAAGLALCLLLLAVVAPSGWLTALLGTATAAGFAVRLLTAPADEPGDKGRGLSTYSLWLVAGVCIAVATGLAATDVADAGWRPAAVAAALAAAAGCLFVVFRRRRAGR